MKRLCRLFGVLGACWGLAAIWARADQPTLMLAVDEIPKASAIRVTCYNLYEAEQVHDGKSLFVQGGVREFVVPASNRVGARHVTMTIAVVSGSATGAGNGDDAKAVTLEVDGKTVVQDVVFRAPNHTHPCVVALTLQDEYLILDYETPSTPESALDVQRVSLWVNIGELKEPITPRRLEEIAREERAAYNATGENARKAFEARREGGIKDQRESKP